MLARMTAGVMFAGSGLRKLGGLDEYTAYFVSLGIPFAELQAPFVAGVEFACGALLVAGLMTRLAAIPLAITMVVAIVAARLDEAQVDSLGEFLYLNEWLLVVLLVWVLMSGPGKFSLDRFLQARLLGASE